MNSIFKKYFKAIAIIFLFCFAAFWLTSKSSYGSGSSDYTKYCGGGCVTLQNCSGSCSCPDACGSGVVPVSSSCKFFDLSKGPPPSGCGGSTTACCCEVLCPTPTPECGYIAPKSCGGGCPSGKTCTTITSPYRDCFCCPGSSGCPTPTPTPCNLCLPGERRCSPSDPKVVQVCSSNRCSWGDSAPCPEGYKCGPVSSTLGVDCVPDPTPTPQPTPGCKGPTGTGLPACSDRPNCPPGTECREVGYGCDCVPTPTPTPPFCDQYHCPGNTQCDGSLIKNESCCQADKYNCHCVTCIDTACGCSGQDCKNPPAGFLPGYCSYGAGSGGDPCKCSFTTPTPSPTPSPTPCPYNCGDSCPVGTYCKPSDCTCQSCNPENCGGPGWKCKTGEFCDSTTSPCTCKTTCHCPGPSLPGGACPWPCAGQCPTGTTCRMSFQFNDCACCDANGKNCIYP